MGKIWTRYIKLSFIGIRFNHPHFHLQYVVNSIVTNIVNIGAGFVIITLFSIGIVSIYIITPILIIYILGFWKILEPRVSDKVKEVVATVDYSGITLWTKIFCQISTLVILLGCFFFIILTIYVYSIF